MKHIQLPILGILHGGAAQSPAEEFQRGRDAAAREIAAAYQRALMMIDPRDLDERAWYQERLRDARCAAGLSPVELLPRARE